MKTLPDAFAADPDRLARFTREAQILASLNHPNIAAIYGIEEDEVEGRRALVLELVEGPTLADRIANGPIPLDEALPIAKQIAEALEAAHEAGVIHRDLKPANIKVREDGTVKVLDFGLAKALDPNPEGDPSQSPTLTAAATQMGVILGTAAYMSPEQARGKPVDKRADIWAFGVVLYEMLSGARPFQGEDVSLTLASVMKSDVNVKTLPRDVPPAVRTVLDRCLEKDPNRRIRDIGDVRLAMDGAFETAGIAPAEQGVAPRLPLLQRPVGIAVTVLVALAVGGAAVWGLMRSDAPTARPVRFTIPVPPPERLSVAAQSSDVAISPDGQRVAYLTGDAADAFGPKQLFLRSLSDFTPTMLAGGAPLYNPFFSPDGEWVGFYDLADLELRRVPVQGESAVPIGDLDSNMSGASWGEDDTLIYATNSGLWRVPSSGGVPEQLTTRDIAGGELGHFWPEILPGGQAVLFTVVSTPVDDSQIAVLSLDTGDVTVVVRGGFHARYAPTGHLVYGVGNTLQAVPFDVARLETTGGAVALVEGVVTKSLGSASFSLSATGSLVYVSGDAASAQARDLVWVDRQGREEPLGTPLAPYESPRVSPDGRFVAVEVRNSENSDVSIYDGERGTLTRLTFDPGADGFPIWAPDGARVVFSSDRDGVLNIYERAADGTGRAQRLTTSDTGQWPQSWSADGQSLVVLEVGRGSLNIQIVSLGAENRTDDLLRTAADEGYAAVSFDGQWMAYVSNESGQFEVYVRPFPNVDDGLWQISRDGGISPVWAPNGQELFFRTLATNEMMVVAVETEPTFSHGTPEALFVASSFRRYGAGRARPFDLSADGERFLMIKEDASGDQTAAEPHIVFVQDWFEELKARVPVN